ncbi:MAG TPA: hypothetical protein DER64_03060 [Planctomycetaceae bacterium]|nr:hypothetical protein [Planctomycetaceae bacterium]
MKATCSACRQGEPASGAGEGVGADSGLFSVTAWATAKGLRETIVAKRCGEVYKQSVPSERMDPRGAESRSRETRLADPVRQFKLIGPTQLRTAGEGSPASDE